MELDRETLRKEREAVVRRHMESENVHDFDTTIATFAHPHYELVPSGAVHDGEAAVRGYFKETRTAFPDQRNELIALRHADDAVIVEFWLLGTHRGPLAGVAPTGKSFRVRMTALFLFEDGGEGIVCERVYFDSASMLRQLTERFAVSLSGQAIRNEDVLSRIGFAGQQVRIYRVDATFDWRFAQAWTASLSVAGMKQDRPDSTATLATISVPTLIVTGDEDTVIPIEDVRALHAAIRGSTLEVISGAGHLSNLERPAAFNHLVSEFLARLTMQ